MISAREVRAILLFLSLVALVYGQTLFFGFVYDDHETIEDNPWIRSVLNFSDFFLNKETTAPGTHLKEEIWRPVKTLSVAFDYLIFKRNSSGFHLTNLFFHFFCVFFLYCLLRERKMEGFWLLFIPSLFAVHPALAQNVAYVSARGDLLAGCFLGICLVFYGRERPFLKYFLSPFAFFLACLSKENAVMLPFFLSAYTLLMKERFLKLLPFWGTMILYLFYRYSIVGSFEQGGYMAENFWLTQASMIKVWALYCTGLLWPFLTGVIPVTGIAGSFFNPNLFFFAAVFLGWIVFCFYFSFSKRFCMMVLLWFVFFLLPASNILPLKALMSWRFCYLSWMGYCLLPWLFFRKRDSFLLRFLLVVWLALLAGKSFEMASQFKNDLTLWTPVLEKHPDLSKPYRVISRYYLAQGREREALSFLDLGLERCGADPLIRLDKASFFVLKNRLKEAWEILDGFSEKESGLAGEDWLSLYAFTAFHLEYFDVLSLLGKGKEDLLPPKVLFLKANALTLKKDYEKAGKLYRELLKRDIPDSMRTDCLVLLGCLNQKKAGNP